MALFFLSFFAGVLTVLAPCVLPILPLVVGRSTLPGARKITPFIVSISLGISVFIFTFLLKVSTAFISIPLEFWASFSGGILIILGIIMLSGDTWEKFIAKLGVQNVAQKNLTKGFQKKNLWGDIIMGASLGPIFSTCSPTYFVILGTVLPANFLQGTIYLLAFVTGLILVLIGIGLLGQRFVNLLNVLSDPNGWFKRISAIIFIIIGLLIFTRTDKKFEAYILEQGVFDISRFERILLDRVQE